MSLLHCVCVCVHLPNNLFEAVSRVWIQVLRLQSQERLWVEIEEVLYKILDYVKSNCSEVYISILTMECLLDVDDIIWMIVG